MQIKPRYLLSVGLAALSALILAIPASASGATVTHQDLSDFSFCNPNGAGGTFCVIFTGQIQTVRTPSGNFDFSANGSVTETDTDSSGATIFSFSEVVHQHQVFTDGGTYLQEFGSHLTLASSFGGVTCTTTVAFHLTNNGQIQYDRSSTTC